MLLWDGQSCIPFLKIIAWSRAEKQVRKRQPAGVSPGTSLSKSHERFGEHRELGRGWGCEPSDVHHSHAAGLKKRGLCWWAELHWRNTGPFTCGVFLPDNLQYSKFSVHWQQHWHTPLLLGWPCRGWAPGNPSFQIPYKHKQSFSWFAGHRGFGLSHSHGCTFVMAYPWEGAHMAKSRTAKSRGVHTAAWTPWASVLGGMRYKCVSERGAGFGGRQTDRAAETDRSWKQTHRSASACLCSAKRHLQSLDHDGCNLLCWNFSIHRLTVQCRKIIYLMCTYLLRCPSNCLPFPSSLQLCELVRGIFQ